MKCFVLAPTLLAGCFIPAFMNSKPGHDPSKYTPPVFEPGMTELEVTNEGIAYGIAPTWANSVHYVLLRGTEKIGEGDLQRAGDNFGGVELIGQRAHAFNRIMIPTETPLAPGDYSLQMTLMWMNEWDEKSTVDGVEHFRVVHVASTAGGRVTIDPTTIATHAAIRANRNDPNLKKTEDGNRMEVPDPAFWITLPTPIGVAETQLDLLFVHDGKVSGHATSKFAISDNMADDVLQMPVRVWGWPKELTPEAMRAQPGPWQVHVVQDGRYVTTCGFRATATGFASTDPKAGEQPHSARLDCAVEGGPEVAAALKEVRGVKAHAPDPRRAKEALALSRSQEVRDQRKRVVELERTVNNLETLAGMSGRDADEAWTRRQEQRAMQNQQDYQEGSQRQQRELAKAQARYAALIDKYSRQVAAR